MAQKLLRRNNRDNRTKLLDPTSEVLAVDGSSDAYTLMTTARAATGVQSANAPEWLDITSDLGGSGGGGSAFDHLTEDAGGGAIHTDLELVVAEDYDTFWNGDGTGRAVDLAPGLVFVQQATAGDAILWGKVSGDAAEQRFKIKADGSISWGDGTDAHDTFLARASTGRLSVYGDDEANVAYASPHDIGLFDGGPDAWAKLILRGAIEDGAGTVGAIEVASDLDDPISLEVDRGNARWLSSTDIAIRPHGGGLRLTSPDGLVTKTIQISNAGTVVAV